MRPGSVEWNPREQAVAIIDVVFVVVDVKCDEAPLRKALARVDPALANVLAAMVERRC